MRVTKARRALREGKRTSTCLLSLFLGSDLGQARPQVIIPEDGLESRAGQKWRPLAGQGRHVGCVCFVSFAVCLLHWVLNARGWL